MGHADIKTTMDIYNEATIDKKKESFENLEDKIKLIQIAPLAAKQEGYNNFNVQYFYKKQS